MIYILLHLANNMGGESNECKHKIYVTITQCSETFLFYKNWIRKKKVGYQHFKDIYKQNLHMSISHM